MSRSLWVLVPCVLISLMTGCALDPFLPDVGTPVFPASPLVKPQGTISQLLNSYETKRIDLFEETIEADSFRFYVSSSFFSTQSNPNTILEPDSIDTRFTYVPSRKYSFWRYDSEHRSHQKLFDKAITITFDILPQINSDDFVYHLDTAGDTLGVEVLMLSGRFTVDYPDPLNDFFIIEQPVDIEKQVFYLVRTAAGEWKIRKWFDMGSATGL
jgi:hypothetical protein